MAILTKSNAKCGCIVRRGPAWCYGDQDMNAVYGVVVSLIANDDYVPQGVIVRWIDAKQRKLREKSYAIAENDKDVAHGSLEFSDALENDNHNEDVLKGEVRPFISEDAVANWNNALELAIDTVMDNKTRSVIAEKLATFKK